MSQVREIYEQRLTWAHKMREAIRSRDIDAFEAVMSDESLLDKEFRNSVLNHGVGEGHDSLSIAPIAFAAAHGGDLAKTMVARLVEKGAFPSGAPDYVNSSRNPASPMHYVASQASILDEDELRQAVEALRAVGCDLNHQDRFGLTPLGSIARYEDDEAIDLARLGLHLATGEEEYLVGYFNVDEDFLEEIEVASSEYSLRSIAPEATTSAPSADDMSL